MEKSARAELTDKIMYLYAENDRDRGRFEDKLGIRDTKIQELEGKLRYQSPVPHPDSLKAKALEDKLTGKELAFEEEGARRVRGMWVEGDEGARERVREGEGEGRDLRRALVGWKGKGKGVKREMGRMSIEY